MLEYMLLRPHERALVQIATRDLRALVVDELYFYRGRQGADVTMLMRRVQQRAVDAVQMIGTSATLATEGDRDDRRTTIAESAGRLLGVDIPSANVIDETLRRVCTVCAPRVATICAPPWKPHLRPPSPMPFDLTLWLRGLKRRLAWRTRRAVSCVVRRSRSKR